MSAGVVKAAIFRSHYEAAKKLPAEEQLAFFRAMLDYQFEGKTEEELPPIVDCLMTAILPVLDRETEAKAGRPECAASAEEIAAKREELGSVKAVAEHFGISERTVYNKLQTAKTAKTAKTKEECRKKNEEGENAERENEEGVKERMSAAQSAAVAAEPPAPPSSAKPSPAARQAKGRKPFTPPTFEEVAAFCKVRGNGIDPEAFIAYYASKGWLVGNSEMQDWRQAVVCWERRDKAEGKAPVTYAHWTPPERPEISGDERAQMEALLGSMMAGLRKKAGAKKQEGAA